MRMSRVKTCIWRRVRDQRVCSPSLLVEPRDRLRSRSAEDLVEYVMQISPTFLDRSKVAVAVEVAMQALNPPTPSPTKSRKGKNKAVSKRTAAGYNGIGTGIDESLVALLQRVGQIIRDQGS